ncbi:MAG: DUF2288 domain-containing protein [Okeania sp. SIO2H7]|nr:DUF2288 domain-containing protein [Okeania sp. SIO2H7]
MEDIRAKLKENLDVAEWDWLIPHVKRDALVVVTPDLDLLDVGVAIASDNVSSVQRWISEALIYKPSAEQISEWNQDRAKKFDAIIVDPFVVVKESSSKDE